MKELFPLLICLLAMTKKVSCAENDMVNIALGKKYRQSSYHPGFSSSPSSHAANGDTSGVYNENNCIHTEEGVGDRTPYWEVDLGRDYILSTFTVWGRQGMIYRLYPFTITVDGEVCVRVISEPNARRINVSCYEPMYGQKVRITKDHKNSDETLNLCEFQIWVPRGLVNCPVGQYGADCSKSCGSHCGPRKDIPLCYQTSGVCANGCLKGHYGDKCDKLCSENCASQCDRKSGHCTCKPGYQAPDCKLENDNTQDTGKIIGAVVGSVAGTGVIVAVFVAVMYWRKKSTPASAPTVVVWCTDPQKKGSS